MPQFGLSAQPTADEGERSFHDTGLTWRLNLSYAPTPDSRTYLSYARGRRPKVTSAAAPLAPGGDAVFTDLAAETVDAFETGGKLATPDGRLSLDAAAYFYAYRNFQTQTLQNARLVSIDAGRARAYGVETQASWRAFRGATLFATYAWSHTRFTSGAYRGNRFRLNPAHSASLGATLTAALAAGALEATPTVTYRSRLFFDTTNGKSGLLAGAFLLPLSYDPSQSGYALANFDLAFAPTGSRFRIEGHVANLFDKHYLRDTGQGSLAFGLPTYIAAPPRTYTVSLTWKG